jgi:predicted phosphoribosyltransferase
MFKDRIEAGKKLAEKILELKNEGKIKDPVVVALPRGGVPIGYEIAKVLKAPLNLLFVKKIPAPFNEELAIGSISEAGLSMVNKEMMEKFNIDESYLQEKAKEVIQKIAVYRDKYKDEPIPLEDKDVILVDDGIATGASMYLAAQSIAMERPKTLTIAVPVAPNDPGLINMLENMSNNLIILHKPDLFMSVGQWYEDFHQLSDEEVKEYLKNAKEFSVDK